MFLMIAASFKLEFLDLQCCSRLFRASRLGLAPNTPSFSSIRSVALLAPVASFSAHGIGRLRATSKGSVGVDPIHLASNPLPIDSSIDAYCVPVTDAIHPPSQ